MAHPIFLLAVSIVYSVFYVAYGHFRKVCLMNQLQCRPAPPIPQDWLGIGFLLKQIQALRQNRVLDWSLSVFKEHGKTFEIVKFGQQNIYTAEPENIKAVLGTQFEDFEISWMRNTAFFPFAGLGIVTSNGTFVS